MKKLFIVLCDIMAVVSALTVGTLVMWGIAAALGWSNAGDMLAFCAGLAIVDVVTIVAVFIVWKNGGAPGGDDPPTEEGIK